MSCTCIRVAPPRPLCAMERSIFLLVLLVHSAAAQWGGNESGFAPGWNGEARKPVLGWRSWNCFGARVSDELMREAIDAVAAKNWTVDGEKVSLADVGYSSVGAYPSLVSCQPRPSAAARTPRGSD